LFGDDFEKKAIERNENEKKKKKKKKKIKKIYLKNK